MCDIKWNDNQFAFYSQDRFVEIVFSFTHYMYYDQVIY